MSCHCHTTITTETASLVSKCTSISLKLPLVRFTPKDLETASSSKSILPPDPYWRGHNVRYHYNEGGMAWETKDVFCHTFHPLLLPQLGSPFLAWYGGAHPDDFSFLWKTHHWTFIGEELEIDICDIIWISSKQFNSSFIFSVGLWWLSNQWCCVHVHMIFEWGDTQFTGSI